MSGPTYQEPSGFCRRANHLSDPAIILSICFASTEVLALGTSPANVLETAPMRIAHQTNDRIMHRRNKDRMKLLFRSTHQSGWIRRQMSMAMLPKEVAVANQTHAPAKI